MDTWNSNFTLTCIGAFVGAAAAFGMQVVENIRERNEADHLAGVKAQMALIGMINHLRNLDRDHLAPLKTLPPEDRSQMLKHIGEIDPAQGINFESLGFLFKKVKDPRLLQRLHLGQRNYQGACAAFSVRNAYYLGVIGKAEVANFDVSQLTTGEFNLVLKPLDHYMLGQFTDAIFGSVAPTEKELTQLYKEFYVALRKVFPAHDLIRIDKWPPDLRRPVV